MTGFTNDPNRWMAAFGWSGLATHPDYVDATVLASGALLVTFVFGRFLQADQVRQMSGELLPLESLEAFEGLEAVASRAPHGVGTTTEIQFHYGFDADVVDRVAERFAATTKGAQS